MKNENNRNSETQEPEIIEENVLESTTEELTPPTEKRSALKEIYEWISSVAVALVLAVIINQFFFALVQVDGQSMEPTLQHNDRLVVSKFMYTPEQKDVVIVKSDAIQKFIVKRVIALPGQSVDFDTSMHTLVDGKLVEENYIAELPISSGHLYAYPLTVPKKGEKATLHALIVESSLRAAQGTMSLEILADGTAKVKGSKLVEDGTFIEGETTYKQDCYFVLGDNRNHSSDSRTLGLIPEDEIVGKAVLRVFPFSDISKLTNE